MSDQNDQQTELHELVNALGREVKVLNDNVLRLTAEVARLATEVGPVRRLRQRTSAGLFVIGLVLGLTGVTAVQNHRTAESTCVEANRTRAAVLDVIELAESQSLQNEHDPAQTKRVHAFFDPAKEALQPIECHRSWLPW